MSRIKSYGLKKFLIKDFGLKLKMIRGKSGKTLQQVSKELNVTACTISGWEQGHRTPRGALLIKLAKIYDVPVEVFLEKQYVEQFKTVYTEPTLILNDQDQGSQRTEIFNYCWEVPVVFEKSLKNIDPKNIGNFYKTQRRVSLYMFNDDRNEEFFAFAQMDDNMFNAHDPINSIPAQCFVICSTLINLNEKQKYLAVIKLQNQVMLRQIELEDNKFKIYTLKTQTVQTVNKDDLEIFGLAQRIYKQLKTD